jgi:DNA replication and repair protein RecF
VVLKKLLIEGFRNLEDTAVEFSSKTNLIFGPNASGKTSLLEAIYYLAVGRSFRSSREEELKKFGAPYLKVRGEVLADDQYYTAQITFCDKTKILQFQEQRINKLSDYLGWLPVITILLSDIELISGPPQRRRNFIDLAIAQTNRGYLKDLIEFRKALMERNKLLTQNVDQVYFEIWEKMLAQSAAKIIIERQKKLPILLEYAQRFSKSLFPDKKIIFSYKSNCNFLNASTANELAVLFEQELKARRSQDRELGRTTIGPHRDELIVFEKKNSGNELPLRLYASEGEQRLGALVLKLAEAQLIKEFRKTSPIYLLDEVAAELDIENTKKLFSLIDGQLFYATARDYEKLGFEVSRHLILEKGMIRISL